MNKNKLLPLPFTVKKSNELIRNKVTIKNVLAGRILANFISLIKATDKSFFEYEIPIKDFLENTGGGNYGQIKEAIYTLVEKCNFERKLGGTDYEVIPVFSSIGEKNNKVFCCFNDKLKPYLLELQANYTKYNLIEFLKLPSLYSQKIFELLKSWEKNKDVVIKLEDLYRILDVPKSIQKYADLRRWVLEKAYIDIHAKTSLRFEWEAIKTKNKVTAIKFIFGRQAVIAKEENKKAEQKKQSEINNLLFKNAWVCVQNKKGQCQEQDNKAKFCEICQSSDFCNAFLKKYNEQAKLV